MKFNLAKELAALERMGPTELRERYFEVFGEATNGNCKRWLVKRIAWRMQANAEGALAERALARAHELANDADLRTTAPKAKPAPTTPQAPTSAATVATSAGAVGTVGSGDPRLPMPGTEITREYKGRMIRVLVLGNGSFEFEGEVYKSLSAVAKRVSGSHTNGFLFFGLTKTGGAK
jgi:hypothetical protein